MNLTKCVGGDIYNTDLQRDSDEAKGCSKRGDPCTARLNGLNCDILWHNEGIWRDTYQCLYHRCHFGPRSTWQPILASSTGLPTRPYPLYIAPGMQHSVKLRYGVDNPGEAGSTVVYPPSWIRVNSVRKVANATLQFWRSWLVIAYSIYCTCICSHCTHSLLIILFLIVVTAVIVH